MTENIFKSTLSQKRRQLLHVRQRGRSGHVKISWAAAAQVETAERWRKASGHKSAGFNFLLTTFCQQSRAHWTLNM